MHRLYEIGFRPVGRWMLENEQLKLDLYSLVEYQNVLYAFTSDKEVKYVGKTTQTLRRRMLGYLRPSGSQRTNWRNHDAIKALLKQGVEVEILALADLGIHRVGAFHLNFAAGLEDSIIKVLNPEWNGGRTSTVVESEEEANPPDTSEAALMESKILSVAPTFPLTLHETYFKRGFFNVPIHVADQFGGDMAEIEIYCGHEKLALTGKINRTANSNGSPRIMCGVPLREWFQKLNPMEQLAVTILSPTAVEIRRDLSK